MATIKLEIVSPDKVVYTADINMLIVRSTAGELGILPKHAPMVTGLLPHAMRVKIDDTESLIAVAGGFMEVQPEKITVLASAAELPVEIDVLRAQKAYDRARERLEAFKSGRGRQTDPPIDNKRAEIALQRAMARLRACGKSIE